MRDLGIISYMASQRWALHAPVLEAACGVIGRHARAEKAGAAVIAGVVAGRDAKQAARMAEMEIGDDEPYTVQGRVAVVPVSGVLCKYADMINGVSQPTGMTSEQVSMSILAAAQAPNVESLLLDIDSPGGTVAGVRDMLDAIAQVREAGIGVTAFAHDLAASAAYWVALAADSIYLTDLAEVGSIGVYSVLTDYSRADANEGIVTHVIASGKDKGVGAGGPIEHDQLAVIKEDIDRMAGMFRAAVAQSRELNDEQVAAVSTGRTFVGQDAVDRGLADGVMTFRNLVGVMNEGVATARW